MTKSVSFMRLKEWRWFHKPKKERNSQRDSRRTDSHINHIFTVKSYYYSSYNVIASLRTFPVALRNGFTLASYANMAKDCVLNKNFSLSYGFSRLLYNYIQIKYILLQMLVMWNFVLYYRRNVMARLWLKVRLHIRSERPSRREVLMDS